MPGSGERMRLPSLSSESDTHKEKYRVVVMGAAKVGKSAIISQFLYDKFLPIYKETIEEMHRGEYDVDGATLILDILDTSGAYQFPAMRALNISSADAFILVYSVDNAESWEEVRRLRDLIIDSRYPQIPIVIVGNKSDVASEKRAVPRELAETIALFDWENGYVECSAKDNSNIVMVFKELLSQAKVSYNLSPAVKRRRQSLPNYSTAGGARSKHMLKRNSCTVA